MCMNHSFHHANQIHTHVTVITLLQGRDCSVNIDRQGNRKSVSGALSVCGARLEDDFYSGQQPSIDDDCDCQYPVAWGMRARPHSEMTVGGRLATQ